MHQALQVCAWNVLFAFSILHDKHETIQRILAAVLLIYGLTCIVFCFHPKDAEIDDSRDLITIQESSSKLVLIYHLKE